MQARPHRRHRNRLRPVAMRSSPSAKYSDDPEVFRAFICDVLNQAVSRAGFTSGRSRPASRESWSAYELPPPLQPAPATARFGLPRPAAANATTAVHPAQAAPLARDAFGPRANVMSTQDAERPAAPLLGSSPDGGGSGSGPGSGSHDSEQGDETGGLRGLKQQPEARDSLPDTETLMFRDGRRRIDMVLVYEEQEEGLGVLTEEEALRRQRRQVFEEYLIKDGLELELEDKSMAYDGKTYFLKIHIPWKALARYAEVMNLKLPTKGLKQFTREKAVVDITAASCRIMKATATATISEPLGRPLRLVILTGGSEEVTSAKKDSRRSLLPALPFGGNSNSNSNSNGNSNSPGIKVWFPFNLRKMFEYNQHRITREPSFYGNAKVGSEKDDRFLVKEREMFFTAAQRSLVVWQVLLRTKFDESGKVGIRRLLSDKTYLAAFPLHEGRYEVDSPSGYVFDRRLLYAEWGQLSCWYKRQPLWLVKKYFGDKIGLYYVWLGFYTKMLIPAALVGILCFVYGLGTIESDDNMPSKEICDDKRAGNITLCPLCDKACTYVRLGKSCLFSKLTYLFDNPATVFFAIFMSFWATMFLEMWKRRQAVIVWEWDLSNSEEDEEPRPEFEMSVKTFRINPVTREREPYLPTWSKAWRFFATTSMVVFMLLVVMGAVLGTIVYRISMVTVIHSNGDRFFTENAKIFTSITAAVINLVIIMILTNLYKRLALHLTNLENPRTQTEYEDSYTFKIFVFQFVNFYSSLIYIAFFKGRFFKHPGDKSARETEFVRIKTDVCDPAGCLSELCIQLAIIMVGKQFFNNFLEILFPKIRNWWRKRNHRSATKDLERKYTRWEEDYHLEDAGRLALFEEYLEMVLQYGFVTLFVAAFPLAPLFALINNVGEIRLDAYKMLSQARRPLAERVEDIGAWYGILQGVTYMAVVSNAFVIGYTSDFIPRMVYKYGYSNDSSLRGYIDSSLSDFNTSDYLQDMGGPDNPDEPDPPTCQYRGYRKGYNEPLEEKYELSAQYWHVFAARLAFVVVFEHIVFALTGVMAYAIPDVPGEVKTQIQRERLLEKEAKYENGLRREADGGGACGGKGGGVSASDALALIREASSSTGSTPGRGWWGRRLSKVTDSLNAERRRRSVSPTVWEEP